MVESTPVHIQESAATVICGAWRRYSALVQCRTLYEACHDPDSGYSYYYNTVTGASSWEPPLLFLSLQDIRLRLNMAVNNNIHGSKTCLAVDKQSKVVREAEPAPFPATNASVYEAWRTQFPELDNPNDAVLMRVDVYTAESPLRCMFVQGTGVGRQRNPGEAWTLYQSFFAYSAPLDATQSFTVFSSTDKLQKSMAVTDVSKVDKKRWKRSFEFFAYYCPAKQTTRLNVQEVVNPIRQRISSHASVRGGWSYKFCFFAYAAFQIKVLQIQKPESKSECQQSLCLRVGDHGTIDYELVDPTKWAEDFSFFGFRTPAPGMTTLHVCEHRITKQHTIRMDAGSCGSWESVFKFSAYELPMPYTTKYYVQVARAPTRYRISLYEALGPWKCLFAFYAYSGRTKDQYSWLQEPKGWIMKS